MKRGLLESYQTNSKRQFGAGHRTNPSEIIQKVIKTLPRGKAGNDEHVVYEHFIYGMQEVAPVLANLYTYML